jgi:hypothetical protein
MNAGSGAMTVDWLKGTRGKEREWCGRGRLVAKSQLLPEVTTLSYTGTRRSLGFEREKKTDVGGLAFRWKAAAWLVVVAGGVMLFCIC